MNDEQLIECVKKHNVLYDLSHAKYMDITLKNNIWKKIGEQMNTKGQLCKTRWNNIRDTFRKYLKKNVTKSGQSGKIIKRYKYADQLSFLKKHLTEREPKTNIKEFDKTQQGSEEMVPADEESDSGDEVEQDVAAPSQEIKEETNSQIEDWSDSIQRTEQLPVQKHTTSEKRTSKRKVAYSQPTDAAKLLDFLIAKNETPITVTTQPDAVDAFLTGITPALKSLSPLNFHFAKSEIFSIVQKYELKSLEEQNVQGLHCNHAQQQSQFIRRSPNAISSTALLKLSPASSQYSSTSNNTLMGSPDYIQLQSPPPSHG